MGHIYLLPINPIRSPMKVTGKDISFCGVIIGSYTPELVPTPLSWFLHP
ncbi:hypothetical protein [Microbulbifer variabilis]